MQMSPEQDPNKVIRSIFDATPDPVVIVRQSGQIAYANVAAVARYGYSASEFLQIRVHDLAANHLREKVPLHLPAADRPGEQFDWVHRTKDGRELPVEIYTQPIIYEGAPARLSTFRDVSARKLHEQLQRLQAAIVSNMASGICLVSAESGVIVYANSVYEAMLGYEGGELLGRPVSIVNAPTEKSPVEVADEIIALVAKNGHWEGEVKNLRRDGRAIWCSSVVTVFDHWQFGRVWLGVNNDVTDAHMVRTERDEAIKHLNLALADKNALIREVHHRVKNNLQVISSLLRLEGARITDHVTGGVLSNMQGRVRSMALIHESLYRTGNYASIDMAAYLSVLARQVFDSHVSRGGLIELQLNLQAVAVSPDQAVTCALLVNELITNALKHGFPLGQAGVVAIDLHPIGDTSVWRIQIRDTGVGLPTNFRELQVDSLGLQLIGDLAGQLEGTLEIEAGQGNGTVASISFTPLPGNSQKAGAAFSKNFPSSLEMANE